MGTARPAPLRRWGCPGKRVAEMNSYAEIAALRWHQVAGAQVRGVFPKDTVCSNFYQAQVDLRPTALRLCTSTLAR
jgi:hypothetical protein